MSFFIETKMKKKKKKKKEKRKRKKINKSNKKKTKWFVESYRPIKIRFDETQF